LAIPGGRAEHPRIRRDDALRLLEDGIPSRLGKLDLTRRVLAQRQRVLLGVDHFFDRPAKWQAYLGEPNGVKVRAQQRLVREIEARRTHAARHHVLAAAEEILVVAVERAAVGEHKTRLPLPARAAASLGV